MKRALLFGILCCTISLLHAQEFYPLVVRTPDTGMEKLRSDNPYYIVLYPDDVNGGWKPITRYIRDKAPNAPYTGLDIVSSWDTTHWTNNQHTSDSFVLDDQNRIHMVFVKAAYSYPGFSSISKEKYIFDYDAQNRINKIDYFRTEPDTSNKYVRQSITYLMYDTEGKRTKDSTLYYYSGIQRYLTHYHYDGNRLIESDQLYITGDTTGKTIYTYSGDLVTSSSNLSFDMNSDEWTLNYTDTFEYDAQNMVSRRISAGYVYIDGEMFFQPFRNDSYQYTNDKQLKEMITRFWDEGDWIIYRKTEITYSQEGKAEIGYDYPYVSGTWGTTPTAQYLFTFNTGLQTASVEVPDVSVFPNPATDHISIHTKNMSAEVKMIDLYGKLLLEGKVKDNRNIDVSQWSNGVYYLVVTDGEQQSVQKVVVAH